ncbi:AzlC family ABC transporter permease [Pannonibacter sp. Q-1]
MTQSDMPPPGTGTGAAPAPETEAVLPARLWAFRGARAAISIPGFILAAAFVGYAGLARESGLTLPQTLMMAGLVWALPSIVVLTGAIASGMGLIPAAIAVALASVRLMPMAVALMPVLRAEKKAPTWLLLFASHFVAITAWVFAMRNLPDLPRSGRLPFFLGFACFLTGTVTVVTGVSYVLIDAMPPMVAGALFLLTPVYFLCSLWTAGRLPTDKLAMILGLVLGPLVYWLVPGPDLLITGAAGGTTAYLAVRIARRAGWGAG